MFTCDALMLSVLIHSGQNLMPRSQKPFSFIKPSRMRAVRFALRRLRPGGCAGVASPAAQAVRALSTASQPSYTHGEYDLCVVGGGIVGLATAREVLMRFPHLTVAVVEKEGAVASHQSSHNSGVIHAGIYYQPGVRHVTLCPAEQLRPPHHVADAAPSSRGRLHDGALLRARRGDDV